MYTKINEQIEVFANFTTKGTEPICFSWRNNDYSIKSIDFKHSSKIGNKKVFHFSVNANNETYKITFHASDLLWILDEIFLDKGFETTNSLNDKKYIKYLSH